jgi:hypothetical protein
MYMYTETTAETGPANRGIQGRRGSALTSTRYFLTHVIHYGGRSTQPPFMLPPTDPGMNLAETTLAST